MRPARTVRLHSVRSTQDHARRLAERGAPDHTLVVAERQTRGRGRMDRDWSSGRGGVYFSLVLRPDASPRRLASLSREAGRAVARAVRAASGLSTRVKPPNDVLARLPGGPWRKVAGILIEAMTDSSARLQWVVVGVGINAANRLPAGLDHAATLSELAGRRLAPGPVLRRAVSELLKTFAAWDRPRT